MKFIPLIPFIGFFLAEDEALEDNVIFISSAIIQVCSIMFSLGFIYHLQH